MDGMISLLFSEKERQTFKLAIKSVHPSDE
jgi:hypothetical protein